MNLNLRDVYTVTLTIADNKAGVESLVREITGRGQTEIIAYEILGPFTIRLEPK